MIQITSFFFNFFYFYLIVLVKWNVMGLLCSWVSSLCRQIDCVTFCVMWYDSCEFWSYLFWQVSCIILIGVCSLEISEYRHSYKIINILPKIKTEVIVQTCLQIFIRLYFEALVVFIKLTSLCLQAPGVKIHKSIYYISGHVLISTQHWLFDTSIKINDKNDYQPHS